jgi:hypothetical protein
MNPAVVVAALSLLFGGSHIGLAALRARLVARSGEVGFAVLFSAVASVSFAHWSRTTLPIASTAGPASRLALRRACAGC